MMKLRIIGFLLFIVGGVMLILLYTPHKEWALNHSVASFVAASDRKANNSIDTAVDMPMAVAGDVVLMFTGLWTALLIPHQLNKFRRGREQEAERLYPDQPKPE